MQLNATQAKNRFGFALSQCQREPLAIVKNGLVQAFMISSEHYAALQAATHKQTTDQEALKRSQFAKTHQAWFDAQNAAVESQGVFGEQWRAW